MDFSFLQAAGADLPPKKANQSDMADVTIRIDADAFMLCDGEYMEDIQLKAGIIKKMQLPIGQHLLEFISSDNPDMKVEKQVDFPLPGRNYLVLVNELKALIDAPAQLEQQRQAEEAEKKRKAKEAARKKAEEETERKRKAEEAARKKAEEETERKRKAEEAARKKAEEERIRRTTPNYLFEEGKKVLSWDYDRGLEMIREASNKGLAKASKFLAFGFAGGTHGIQRQENLALDYWLAFINQADKDDEDLAKVNYKLGYSYQYGKFGAPKDFNRSVYYYEQAAKLGDVESLHNLAFGYNDGQGCFPRDDEAALDYLLKFAAKGDETYQDYAKALFFLGITYKMGFAGADVDLEKAFSFMKQSAELGYHPAQQQIDCIKGVGLSNWASGNYRYQDYFI